MSGYRFQQRRRRRSNALITADDKSLRPQREAFLKARRERRQKGATS